VVSELALTEASRFIRRSVKTICKNCTTQERNLVSEAGKLVKSGVILAGTDRVAVNVVALGILRSLGRTRAVSAGPVWNLEQIQRSVYLGLGVGSAEQIELVIADSESPKMAGLIRKWIVA
jgi:uncharacterized protein (DUF362 family)